MGRVIFFSMSAGLLVVLFGCGKASDTKPVVSGTADHQHAADDVLVWELKEKIADTDYEIWLGQHGEHFHGGDSIEPAVAITMAGTPVDNAKVFAALVDPANSDKLVVAEVATVFEPATEEIAHYAQGMLKIPAAATKCIIRYRVEIDGQPEYVRDIIMGVGG